MRVIVNPSSISGVVTAPASKSAMQRACAASLIKGGTTILKNPGTSADDIAALDIITRLGATVTAIDSTIKIESNGISPKSTELYCGESGLSVRMFTPIASASKTKMFINGEGSLTKRPLSFFEKVLPELNVACQSHDGYLPLQIMGPLVPSNIEIDGSLSSQFLTGLLMAYSAQGAEHVCIKVKNLNSKPYIDLTLKVMSDFGLQVPINNNYESFCFEERKHNSTNEILQYTVEGDWSGGAFLLVAGAISGGITVKGLDVYSTQADKAILRALMLSEAKLSIRENEIEVAPNSLKAFHFNANDCPDLFPPLVALACFCKGTSVIEGTGRLTHKESNRAETLKAEFGKMGYEITLQDDLMIVHGGKKPNPGTVTSHHDHRIAMACAVAALQAEGSISIEDAEAVNKSYPEFWNHLKLLNASISLIN